MQPHPDDNSSGGGDAGSGSGGGGAAPPAAPFRSSNAHRRDPHGHDDRTGSTDQSRLYYQPSVHQFSCRGAFHVQYDNFAGKDKNGVATAVDGGNDLEDDLEALLRDTFHCTGFQTKLRRVADYPLAESKEEAMRWFYDAGPDGSAAGRNAATAAGGLEVEVASAPPGGSAAGAPRRYVDAAGGEAGEPAPAPERSYASYGTTQVNVLTVQAVPVVVRPPEAVGQRADDAFGGFGALANPAGMLNPFGSLFGGLFGGAAGGGLDGGRAPWGPSPPGDAPPGHAAPGGPSGGGGAPWFRGSSRSVSSSTRMDRDEGGKRVVTTVATTTTVESGGRRTTEVVTTERHVDDGGRVETRRTVRTDGTPGREGVAAAHDSREAPPPRERRPTMPRPSPFHHGPAVVQAAAPAAPAVVAGITTTGLLGVSITEGAADGPEAPPAANAAAGWRKTEYLFRLGRFLPPFMIVNKHYQDKEEEARRRAALQKEYADMRGRHAEKSWRERLPGMGGRAAEGDGEASSADNHLSRASSRAEYCLQRLYVQMGKNATMMATLAAAMTQPGFPKQVHAAGTKIAGNMGPTADRTGKLMGDVWGLWMGALGWDGGWNGGGGGAKGGGK